MLQAICNKFLALDPEIHLSTVDLQGKHIAIICNDYNLPAAYACFDGAQILFSSSKPEHVDVSIQGNVKDFVHFALFKDPKVLQIDGDAMVAGMLHKLYQRLDIDWEEELSKHTGDVIAYNVLSCFSKVKKYTQNSLQALGAMTTEYLQEEAEALVTQHEIDQFMHEVDALRLRVDRLVARIAAYESN